MIFLLIQQNFVQASNIELKLPPQHLKYIFLWENDTLLVIIKNGLDIDQEKLFGKILSRYKIAIRWSIVDIKGISPTVCLHRILLEDE